MERLIYVSFILTTCFMLANCARIHVVNPLSYATSPEPSSPDVPTTAGSPSLDDCDDVIYGMADCIPFLSDGNTNTKPEGSCCSGLEMVLKASDDCICEAIESSTDMGIPINMTKAMTLPSACEISAPSFLSECNLPLPPGASPHVHPTPKSSPKSPSPEPSQAPTSSINVVPAPVTAPHAGTYSLSASLALILSMLSASFYCISF
ncbi:hypothetical protein ACFX16_044180 [Malus domestica]